MVAEDQADEPREERGGTDGQDRPDRDAGLADTDEEGRLVGGRRERRGEERTARPAEVRDGRADPRGRDRGEGEAADQDADRADGGRGQGAVEQGLRGPGRAPEGGPGGEEERPGPAVGAGRGPGRRAQKVALSPQAQDPDEFGLSIENPEASSDSFQSMVAPVR